ncbi:hypothetical protein CLG96_01970 [Sphingomonas oleivorans]|uniref:SAM-dependent methyltransferase n=1 Tax=Sphingomonas oleivorans TaxID=1735121 RepID=A0A2T5G1C4_9SPHN|nr:class I SAM-dependent methyltransferase [Sphingomonas oleivorans]PTQ12932.1 hypothetical protein CLG96_01970 [Sphingomonas oleivorans]
MAEAAVKIADDVAEVLRSAVADGNVVRLPARQLDRKLYQATDKVLQALGGKWNTKAKGHVFANDPAEKLASALSSGRAVDELLTRKKSLQFFETPADLAGRLCDAIKIGPCDICLEPSAGHGRIVAAMRERFPFSVEAVEIDPDNCAVLREQGKVSVGRLHCADFLDWAVSEEAYRPNKIAMNPPFTRNQDIRHVRHAFNVLAPGGQLAAIVSEHGFIGQERETVEFREWLTDVRADVEIIPAGAFKESGTAIQTRMILIRKAR